jgi:predicted MFS family arabinose efflux permease
MGFRTGELQGRFDAVQAVLRHPAFRLFSIGNFASLLAIWIVRVCIGWLTWELTRSKTWLGLMAFAELGPSILVSIYAGPLADRVNKFAILRMGQWLQVALALVLAGLALSGRNSIGVMLVVMVGFSVIGGLTLPARLSVAPSLVERAHLATASAIGSVTLNLTRLLGPLIAAPMIVASLEGVAFLLAAAGFAANALCLGAIGPVGRSAAEGHAPAANQGGYAELGRFLRLDDRLWQLLVLQFVLWLSLRPLSDMLPAFADQVFGAGERGYAVLAAAVGIGAISGAVYTMGQSEERGIRALVLGGAVAGAAMMIAFALADALWLGIILLALYGGTITATGIAATTFIQLQTPRDKLGRIMSLYSLIFRFGPAAGAVIMGFAADRIGLAPAIIGMAALALVAIAIYQQRTKAVENGPRQ